MSKTSKPPTSPSPAHDPLGPFEHAVIALFDGALKDTSFPGIDRAVLGEATQKTIDAQLVVEAAEHELDLARRALDGAEHAAVGDALPTQFHDELDLARIAGRHAGARLSWPATAGHPGDDGHCGAMRLPNLLQSNKT